jgi:trehalose/maltose transport system permease protein
VTARGDLAGTRAPGAEAARPRSGSRRQGEAPAWRAEAVRRAGPTLPGRLARALGLAAVLGWSLGPAVWQALTAFKPDAQITRVPTVYLPHPFTLAHVAELWARKPFGTYLANSAWISAAATALCVVLGAMAASVLARTPGRRRERLLLGLLFVSLFPPILLLFPLYEGVRALGWINHPAALIVPYAALNLPLAVWILESGFRALPRELDEAARLDGLSAWARLRRIHLPLALPSVSTAAILVFIFCWNEFMLALSFMTRDAHKTVTAGIASVSGASLYEIPWGQLSAAVILSTLPLVFLVLLFERRIVSGLTRGALKG